MKVSIVTISYNQADFLEQAILSVINQDYIDIEYIIVDCGSNDASREIINRYSSKCSHVILEPDNGPADGLNKGFNLANGEIFGFLNADDILTGDAISKVVNFFKSNPKYDIVSGHCFIINRNNLIVRKSFSDPFSKRMYAYGAAELMQPSTFFKSECFRKIDGFNIDNKSNWDSELFIDMSLANANFGLINDFLSFYRLHKNSITSSKRLDEKIKIFYKNRFYKLIGREYNGYDSLLRVIFLACKYLKSPRSFIERLSKGSIYGKTI